MNSSWQSVFLSVFVILAWNSVTAIIFMVRYFSEFCHSGHCMRMDNFLRIFEKMGSISNVVKYVLSASVDKFDLARSGAGREPFVKRQDKRVAGQFPTPNAIFALAIIALAVMALELYAGTRVIDLMIQSSTKQTKSVGEMELIKFGRGGRPLTSDECTTKGIRINEETGFTDTVVTRQDVRLDAFFYVTRWENAFIPTQDLPISAELCQTPEKDIVLNVTNMLRFGVSLSMRPSVTGIDGTSKSYDLFDGSFADNQDIIDALLGLLFQKGLHNSSSIEYSDKKYKFFLNSTLTEIEQVVNSMQMSHCDLFTVGKIENNTFNNDTIIPVSLTATEKFPPEFWVAFAVMATISILMTFVSMCEFDDTEKLVILSRDIKASIKGGDLNCIASPITGLMEEVPLKFSRIDPHHIRYGHLVEREKCFVQENDTVGGTAVASIHRKRKTKWLEAIFKELLLRESEELQDVVNKIDTALTDEMESVSVTHSHGSDEEVRFPRSLQSDLEVGETIVEQRSQELTDAGNVLVEVHLGENDSEDVLPRLAVPLPGRASF